MLSVFSLLESGILLGCSYSYNIWLLYLGYIVFGVIYHTMVTVASFEVAKYISEDSYALVFGVNTFFALLTQSLLTFVVINTLLLDIRQQFFVYGSYFLILTVLYIAMGTVNIVQQYRSGAGFHVWVRNNDKSSSASDESNIEPSKSERDGSWNRHILADNSTCSSNHVHNFLIELVNAAIIIYIKQVLLSILHVLFSTRRFVVPENFIRRNLSLFYIQYTHTQY